MRRWQVHLAAALAAVYLLLAVPSAVCVFTGTFAFPAAGHHHHANVKHSALCLLACQGSPGVALAAAAVPGQMLHASTVLPSAGETLHLPSALRLLQSRAPPLS